MACWLLIAPVPVHCFSIAFLTMCLIILNTNKKFGSFKSKENIHKEEVGPYHGLGYESLITDLMNLSKGARGKYCEYASFDNGCFKD